MPAGIFYKTDGITNYKTGFFKIHRIMMKENYSCKIQGYFVS